ncbi:hypothetical protein ACNFJ7_12275 [Sphingomonas sp. HT-1]|uniref:hypothetical protein n=1 Tax=unclassified Sphingomonas TaxID=196159 RepID=UPI000318971A|nr:MULTISPECIES: hypothetical protein [unclassified Sphingomonas]KTF68182.1 hypothetical protein ATB93_01610 [Sphingomonas sp. WG]
MRTLWAAGLAAMLIATPVLAQQKQSVGDGAQAPLRDLRINEKKIPDVLLLAASAPYASQGTKSCAQIRNGITQLNAVLGSDADAPEAKGGNGGAIAAAGSRAIVGTLIPGFGLVRMITGADKQEKRVTAAIYGGTIRRAYLKGLGVSKGCRPPAAPTATARAAVPTLPVDKDDKKEDRKD